MHDFQRTDQGLANYHIFLGSDFTVFVEGGPINRTFEEALLNNDSHSSIDISFWKAIFEKLNLKKTCHFKTLGGKKQIEDLIRKIDTISNIICAVDRDYDFIQNKAVTHQRVFYTYGYSWENDVYQEEQVVPYLTNLCMTDELPQDTREKITSHYKTLSNELEEVVKYCHLSFVQSSDFTQKILLSLFNDQTLEIKKDHVAKQAANLPEIPTSKFPVLRNRYDINGKILAHFAYLLIKKYYGKSLDKAILNSGMITFCKTLKDFGFCKDRKKYYQTKIAGLNSSPQRRNTRGA